MIKDFLFNYYRIDKKIKQKNEYIDELKERNRFLEDELSKFNDRFLVPKIYLESKTENNELVLTDSDITKLKNVYKAFGDEMKIIEKIILHQRNVNAKIASSNLNTQEERALARARIEAYTHLYSEFAQARNNVKKNN